MPPETTKTSKTPRKTQDGAKAVEEYQNRRRGKGKAKASPGTPETETAPESSGDGSSVPEGEKGPPAPAPVPQTGSAPSGEPGPGSKPADGIKRINFADAQGEADSAREIALLKAKVVNFAPTIFNVLGPAFEGLAGLIHQHTGVNLMAIDAPYTQITLTDPRQNQRAPAPLAFAHAVAQLFAMVAPGGESRHPAAAVAWGMLGTAAAVLPAVGTQAMETKIRAQGYLLPPGGIAGITPDQLVAMQPQLRAQAAAQAAQNPQPAAPGAPELRVVHRAEPKADG